VGHPPNTDPTGRECVWDDGSFDAEGDPDTGSVGGCQGAGGTWIELGQEGNWTSDPFNSLNQDGRLSQVVKDIWSRKANIVSAIGLDGTAYITHYDSQGRTDATIYGGFVTTYGYYADQVRPIGSQTTVDPDGSMAAGYRQWMLTHPGLPLDPNDRLVQQLSQAVDFMTTNWFGVDTSERICNGRQIGLVSLGTFFGPTILAAPEGATAAEEEAWRLASRGTSLGSTIAGIIGCR
jgi:hypothetical protein